MYSGLFLKKITPIDVGDIFIYRKEPTKPVKIPITD